MEGTIVSILAFIAALTITIFSIFKHFLAPKQHPDEPPLVLSSIPYIGHIIGLLRYGTRYYEILSAKCRLPIFTLPMLNGKVYIVTSPDLVSAVNRNSRYLAFNPFIAQLGKRITGHDEATSTIVQHNLNGDEGRGYVVDVHDNLVASLAPGKALENMTEEVLYEATRCLDTLEIDNEIDLFRWIRSTVTMCSTRAIYGPGNPFDKHPSRRVEAFWDFDHSINLLIANIAPSITAPKGNRARSELGLAFQQYFENYVPGQTHSSAMILARYTANAKYGLTPWNQGRLEVGTLLGILANTIPSIFYMMIHIYSDPCLLLDIREELESSSVISSPEKSERCLRILKMRETSLLHSTFQEMLRVHALGASARYVREDVMLDGRYLLKKGMVVQMPMAVMHQDPLAWGEDVGEFKPRRFLKQQEGSKKFKPNPAAYRPFGGGASLCPGRHFVTLEAMALTACMILKYDVAPVHGDWHIPKQKQESMATNVFPPEKDIRVKVSKRAGVEDVKWTFEMS